jgi:hypothetical protein
MQVPALSQTASVMAQGEVLIDKDVEGHFVVQRER